MKEVKGYIAKDGKFYKTKKEAQIADIETELNDVLSKLEEFDREIQQYIFSNYPLSVEYVYKDERKSVLEAVSKKVLEKSDDFIEIINRKKELSKKLDVLQEKYKKSKWQSTPWYLRLKWWKK